MAKTKFKYPIRLTGGKYCDQEVINDLKVGEDVLLELEPDNPYDEDAIAVFVKRGTVKTKIGYVPRKQIVCPECNTVANAWDDVEHCAACNTDMKKIRVNTAVAEEMRAEGGSRTLSILFHAVKGRGNSTIVVGEME